MGSYGVVPGGTATLSDIVTGLGQEKGAAATAQAQPALVQAQTANEQQVAEQNKLKNQIAQRDLKDQEITRRALINNTPGDIAGIQRYMIQNGISAPGYTGFQSHMADMRQKIATATKDEVGNIQTAHQRVGNIVQAIDQAPAEQQAAMAQQVLPELQQVEPDHQWTVQQLVDPNQRKLILGTHGMMGTILSQGETVAKTNQANAATGQAQAATEQARATTAETQQKTEGEKRTLALQELSGMLDPATGQPSAEDFSKWQQKYPTIAPASMPTKDRIAQMVRGAVPVEKQPEYDLNTMKSRMGLMGNSEYDQFLVQYARSLGGKTPAQLTPEEGLASFGKFAELKKDPVMRELAIAQANFANVMKQAQLDQMPTKEQASMLADDIVNHRLAPDQLSQIRGRGNGQLGLMVYSELKKTDPAFSWEQASSEYQLGKSPGFQQTVKYMDYVGSSVDNVIAAADKLSNGKVRSLNAVKNWTKDQLNGVDLARFNTDRLEVADAIAKILQGGGSGAGTSDKKLEQAESIIRSTDSPEVIRSNMKEIKDLIGKRRSTLTKGTFMEGAKPSGEKPAEGAPAGKKPLSEIFK